MITTFENRSVLKTYLIVMIPIFDTTYKGKKQIKKYMLALYHELVLFLQSRFFFAIYQRMILNGKSRYGPYILCLLGIIRWACFLLLAFYLVFWWLNFWSSFTSCGGIYVDASRYLRLTRVWNIDAYEKLCLLEDILKMHSNPIIFFSLWRDIDYTWFSRSCWGLKIGTEGKVCLLEFCGSWWCFLSSCTLLVCYCLHWVFYCFF